MEQAQSSRRGFFGHAAGAYLTVGAIGLTALAIDPVIDMIGRHQDLFKASLAWPEEDEAGYDAACDRCIDGMNEFVRTVPTTDAGMMAYLNHLESFQVFGGHSIVTEDLEAICETVRQFMKARAA